MKGKHHQGHRYALILIPVVAVAILAALLFTVNAAAQDAVANALAAHQRPGYSFNFGEFGHKAVGSR